MEHNIATQEKIQKTIDKIDVIRKLIREADETGYASDMVITGTLPVMEASILNDLWKKYRKE